MGDAEAGEHAEALLIFGVFVFLPDHLIEAEIHADIVAAMARPGSAAQCIFEDGFHARVIPPADAIVAGHWAFAGIPLGGETELPQSGEPRLIVECGIETGSGSANGLDVIAGRLEIEPIDRLNL